MTQYTTEGATQDVDAKLDYTVSWATDLTANGSATISSATVTCTNADVTISDVTVTDTNTSVTWRLDTTSVTGAPVYIECLVHVVLSTDEEDERTLKVLVTNL